MLRLATGQPTAAVCWLSPRRQAVQPQRRPWTSSVHVPPSIAWTGQHAQHTGLCCQTDQTRCKQMPNRSARLASCGQQRADQGTSSGVVSWSSAAKLRASVLVLVSALAFADPSAADLQTVTAADAVAAARPLAAQPVRKGKVWLLLAGGAAGLFGGTILLENNEQFFPAIARANKAIARSRDQQQKEQQRRQAVVAEREENARLLSALEDGLQSATDRQMAVRASDEDKASTASAKQAGSSNGHRALLPSNEDRADADMAHSHSVESTAKADSGG